MSTHSPVPINPLDRGTPVVESKEGLNYACGTYADSLAI